MGDLTKGVVVLLVAAAAVLTALSCSAQMAALAQRSDGFDVRQAAAEFSHKIPLNAPRLGYDPYEKYRNDIPQVATTSACALRYDQDKIHYTLETFADGAEAHRAGFIVTHSGGCGTCSTLQDLAVYLSRPDLTTPVRQCAMRGITRGRTLNCLRALGFSDACAETFYYNSRNTRRECLRPCLASFVSGEPSNKPDGTLNDCLQCDEDKSGPVFEFVAGRTRRNSGIISSIARADSEIHALVHDYY